MDDTNPTDPDIKVYKTFSHHDFSGYKPHEILRAMEILDQEAVLPRPLQIVQHALARAYENKPEAVHKPFIQVPKKITPQKPEQIVKPLTSCSPEQIQEMRIRSKPHDPLPMPVPPKEITQEEKDKAVLAGANLRSMLGKLPL